MKSQLYAFAVIVCCLTISCNQPKENKGKEEVAKMEEQKKADNPKPIVANGVLLNTENNEPIGMAIVIVNGTNIGTLTDDKGVFKITAPGGAKKLSFSAEGFETLKVNIDGKNKMTVKLKPKAK